MIEKKQPITKQFLLSYKSSHGDFYEKFVEILREKVHFCRRVKQHESCPAYMLTQKCMFMSILQRKNHKFLNQELDIVELSSIFQRYRPQILKSIDSQKNIIFKKMKGFEVQDIQNTIIELVTRQNFSFNSFNLLQNTYVYQLFKAIFDRSEANNFFGDPKYEPLSYDYLQVKKISGLFNENIMYFDYNSSKSSAKNIQFNPYTTYILKVKDKFAILYVNQPKEIEIVEQGIINLKGLQDIFTQLPINNKEEDKFILGKIWNAIQPGKEDIRQSSKMFPQQIECCRCLKKFSQFDCLKWNYQYNCLNCLQNPSLDTSNIPSTLIEKYFTERGIKHTDFPITCAQCTGSTFIPRFNPGNKPPKYKCTICEYTICLIHNMNINLCYCECLKCKNLPTINIVNLNLTVCQFCKKKFCRTCQKLSQDFCNCICKTCFQRKQEDHVCRQRCHFCRNHINNMKTCVCSRKICHGCYYYQLKNVGKNQSFTCPKPYD